MDHVKDLLKRGYAFPCACCHKLGRALARGQASCAGELPPGAECGGPMAGMSFPLYEGPLTLQSLATACFRCGDRAAEAVTSAKQPERFVGICKKHLPMIEALLPDEELPEVG